MERLSYEDYKKYGGRCSVSDFPVLLLDCENCLEKITFGRINNLTREIKRLMVKIIDEVLNAKKYDSRILSYSDGIESFSFSTDEINSQDKKLYNLCRQYLPREMLYRGVNDNNSK